MKHTMEENCLRNACDILRTIEKENIGSQNQSLVKEALVEIYTVRNMVARERDKEEAENDVWVRRAYEEEDAQEAERKTDNATD